MRVALLCLAALVLGLGQREALADSYDIITFSFASVTLHPPGSIPGTEDTIGAIQDSFTTPASPVVFPPGVQLGPDEFWTDPTWAGTPGSYPPIGSKLYLFGPDLAGFVFADDVQYPRAYSYFDVQGTLFTGPASAPTFVPGVYAAQYVAPIFGAGFDPGTITVEAVGGPVSGAPEPETLLLAFTGMMAMGAGWGRQQWRGRGRE